MSWHSLQGHCYHVVGLVIFFSLFSFLFFSTRTIFRRVMGSKRNTTPPVFYINANHPAATATHGGGRGKKILEQDNDGRVDPIAVSGHRLKVKTKKKILDNPKIRLES